MSKMKPDADELEIRGRLIELIDGPAAPPPVPPMPTQRPRDWLDDILDSNPAPAGPQPATGPAAKTNPEPEPPAEEPKRHPKPWPARRRETRDSAPQSLIDAFDQVPRRIRWLIYHATAAGAGWWIGWADWATDTAAWYAAGHWTTPSAWVLYGLGVCSIALYRRARRWAWPVAWAAAVPVSSIVLGVLLYAPTQ